MLKEGQRVIVNAELVDNFDEKIQNEKGVISKVNNWLFPYEVTFDNKKLNELLLTTPRRFAEYELKPDLN